VSSEIVNQHGRRGGRGIRPWILLPKVIAVGLYIGGLASALMIWITSDFAAMGKSDPGRLVVINQVAHLVEYLVVPSLLLALITGALLLLQHPRELIRMRWLQVKLLGLAALIPSAHLYCSSRLGLLRDAFNSGQANDAAATQFTWGLSLALAGSLLIVILGRLKPRLGK
jgi:hypothetical protein